MCEKPRYKCDCKKCVFLGTHEKADLYVCGPRGDKTVLARYSDKDYAAVDVCLIADMAPSRIPDLQEARKRAIERNLV